MGQPYFMAMHRRVLTLALATILAAGLGACASAEQRRQSNQHLDSTTCTEFGATPGSPAYTECMLTQQSRRDHKQRDALKRAALSTQLSKDNLEIGRKLQCDRDAKKDREAGVRPRRCD